MNPPSRTLRARLAFPAALTALLAIGLAAWSMSAGKPAASLPVADVARVRQTRAPSPQWIRVRITAEPVRTATVSIKGAYTIRPVGSSRILARGTGMEKATVRVAGDGFRIGDRDVKSSSVEIVPSASPAVRYDGHLYRGTLRLHRSSKDRLLLVNALPLEEYLASVVDSEMPAKFPAAARQAQAIIARTYALRQIQEASSAAVYDVYATQRSQKYLGTEYEAGGRRLAGESAASREIVQATAGLVCLEQGRLLTAYYSAVCGGRTTNGAEIFEDAEPTLRSVVCEGCRDAERYRWSLTLSAKELLGAITAGAAGQPRLTTVRTIRQTAGPGDGRISRFAVSDGTRTAQVTGVELRGRLPKLQSPHFALRLDGDTVRVEGRGHGHGVGLCQWGSRGLALQGMSSRQILRHYYPGCAVAVFGE